MNQKRNGSTKTVKNFQQFFILVMKIKNSINNRHFWSRRAGRKFHKKKHVKKSHSFGICMGFLYLPSSWSFSLCTSDWLPGNFTKKHVKKSHSFEICMGFLYLLSRDNRGTTRMATNLLGPATPSYRRRIAPHGPSQLRLARTHDTNPKPKSISRLGCHKDTHPNLQ